MEFNYYSATSGVLYYFTNSIIELPDDLKVHSPVVDRQGIPDDIVVPLRRVISEAADTLLEVDDHLRHADLHQGISRNRRLIVNDRIGHRKG